MNIKMNNNTSLEKMQNDANEIMGTLENLLRNNLLALEEYSSEDFEILLEEMKENYQDIEMLTNDIDTIEHYIYEIKEEKNKLQYQSTLKEENIRDIVLDNLNNIIATHTIFFTTLMITSKTPKEFLTKVLITIIISKQSYELIKSYILSNNYKEKTKIKLSEFKNLLKMFELDFYVHSKTKEYYEKEIYFQRQKLKEIAPQKKENETEEEFIERCFSGLGESDNYKIEFIKENRKTRKREK